MTRKTTVFVKRILSLLVIMAMMLPLLPMSARETQAYTRKAKYAVSLYGIESRSVEVGDETVVVEQLTFGPALGANYVNSYKDHTPSGSTDKGNSHRCLHWDSWEEIIHWNDTDPHVYGQCVSERCTHSVELDIPTELQGTISDTALEAASGDGPNVLYNELAGNARRWNAFGSSYGGTGSSYYGNDRGWGATNIRAVLNGKDSLTKVDTFADANNITADKALISAFPQILQDNIAAKRIKYDSVYNAKTAANLKTTYDKLWLFSPNEIGLASSVGSNYQHPLEADSVYDRFAGVPNLAMSSNSFYSGYRNNNGSGVAQSWWLRSSGGSNSSALFVETGGNVASLGVNSKGGVAPGFTLQSQLVRTISYDANGGVGSGDIVESYINSAGGPVRLEGEAGTPTREGYTFAGWAYDARGARAFNVESWDCSEDITVYAKWEPVKVKYAVAIYGIRQDTVLYEGEETTSGLTFGPATGANYLNSYKDHTPSGQTSDGHDHRCVHNDDWGTIVLWNYLDPHVYEQCVSEGCTHSVEIAIPDKLRGAFSTEPINAVTGDGPSILYSEITNGAKLWKGAGSSIATNPGWESTNLRAILNGVDDKTTSPNWALTKNITADNSVFSGFPDILREEIAAKTVKYDSVYNSKTPANLKTTYDKLWLFSPNEIGLASNMSDYYQHPLEADSVYDKFTGQSLTASTNAFYWGYYIYNNAGSGSTSSWWLRSSYGNNSNHVLYVRSSGSVSLSDDGANSNVGVAPGFTLASPSDTGAAKVALDAQGGYTAQSVLVPTSSSEESGTVPTAERPGYELVAWTENADGTGASYQPGDSIAFPTSGIKWLYAQWTEDTRVEYAVKHYQQTADLSDYTLVDTEYIKAHAGDSVSPSTKTYAGFIAPATQTATVADDWSTVVEYRYDRTQYKIRFDGNDATSGQMEDQDMIGALAANLATNSYQKKGSIFQGWNTAADGSGANYTDAQQVNNLTTQNNGTVTLYAQWLSNEDAELSPTNGVIYVQAKAGETVVIPDLPAGTTYTVEEVDNPNGWNLSGYVNEDGTISANATTNAQVNNRYSAEGQAQIVAHKSLNGDTPIEGQFTFELLQGSTLLQTKTNDVLDTDPEVAGDNDTNESNQWVNTAPVIFDPITYTASDIGQTYTYTIREVKGPDDTIVYDEHTETVRVTVFDQGDGILGTNIVYDNDGALFTNEKTKGSLLIKKHAKNATAAALEAEHEFTVVLKDAQGNELTDSYPIVKHIPDTRHVIETIDNTETTIAHSRTSNLSETGAKDSNYGGSWTNTSIRGTGRDTASSEAHVITIPGVSELIVDLYYNGESTSYDWVSVWAGNYPNYTAASNATSAGRVGVEHGAPNNNNKFGGNASNFSGGNFGTYDVNGNSIANLGYTRLTIPGDTVTFGFRSDSSGYGNGYGYYAIVKGTTGEITSVETGETEGYDRLEELSPISSGDAITCKAGESLEIQDLPDGSTYEIIEMEKPGWTLTSASSDTGTIAALSTQTAELTNTYSTIGSFSPSAEKIFYGGDIADKSFEFNLTDENGIVLQTAFSDENGNISFTPIDYDQSDDGKRYVYYIREIPDDTENITWDEHVAEIIVNIADNGEGELIVTPTVNAQDLTFTNVQTGQIEVTKTVAGSMGDKSSEFAFTLKLTGDWDKHSITYTKTLADGTTTSGTAEFTSSLLGAGTYAFTLSHGDTITFDGITNGVNYDIVENDANKDAYTTTAEGAGDVSTDPVDKEVHMQGTLDSSANAAFTNTRDVAVPTNTRMPWYGWALMPVLIAGTVLIIVNIKKKK